MAISDLLTNLDRRFLGSIKKTTHPAPRWVRWAPATVLVPTAVPGLIPVADRLDHQQASLLLWGACASAVLLAVTLNLVAFRWRGRHRSTD